MPKNTPIDKTKQEARENAKADLKARGAMSNETSVAKLRARVKLLERILGISTDSA